ncbi:MAG TPA: DUF3883 domain-containing protein [Acidimicrobiia bacterium]|nr:DUF3883 domain-containing protein [Acidimicrobiia bacterium]
MKPRDLVANESPNRIRDHFNRKARYNPTKSLTALTSQLTQEYEDRFLVELIQNAYDAHPPGTSDGRVHVRLDESADNQPVLYVANTGNSFRERDFDALTNVAQSSKPPGEGIGNKGVGFRSVLQVCDSPEIYSCNPDHLSGPDFDGFCFGFATDLQIHDMVEDESQYEIIKRDFSRYLLPVIASPTDLHLRMLRAIGMVTVVRLPLTTERAVELARTQVHRLLEPTPPVALFLDRLRSISVELVDSDGHQEMAQVDRLVEEVRGAEGGPILRWVETVGTRFLTASRVLTGSDVRSVVREAIGLGELDRSWAAWDSDVEVSLAVPTGLDSHDAGWPSTYTYLPMRVPAPVYAHLHAPFHTKMARLDLNEDSVFNAFLIETAAELAVDTIQRLITGDDLDLDLQTRRAAVVDLLCWNSDHITHLEGALKKAELDLESSPLVPARGPNGGGWAGLDSVRVWNSDGLNVLTAQAIEAHTHLLDQSIGLDRVLRLKAVCEHTLSYDLDPEDHEVADWIEKVAKGLQSASVSKWNRFLSDVASVFESRQPNALQGRFILLDDKKKLRRSGPWDAVGANSSEPTVFIPPSPAAAKKSDAGEGSEFATVPKNLQRAIAFLHHDIKTRTRVGSSYKRTAVGELFKKGDLVEPFELMTVLSHLERLLAGKVSDTTHRQALSWVYAQEHASRSNIADLPRLGLRVPTADGWVPAKQAVFSPEWETPRASAVAALVEDSAGASESIQRFGEGAIRAPADWPFKLTDVDAFREFLARCGVRDGLFPVALHSRTTIRMNGNSFTPSAIANRFGLADYQYWAQHTNETWHPILAGPYTPYTGDQELWMVPGQEAFESFETNTKDRLAATILDSIADWPEEAWTYDFRRRSPQHRHKPDPQAWPSPARTFVEKADWFPMSDAGRRDDHYFVPLQEGWTFDETASETAPRFARLAPIDHRRRLTASKPAQERLEKAGLKTWNSPASAGPRLAELARLVASGEVAEAELPSVRRAASRAWSELVGLSPLTVSPDLRLVTSRGSALGILEPSDSKTPGLFVHDVPPGLVAQVLEAGSFPLLVADPADGERIADALAGNEGIRVQRTSTVEAKIVLDGRELTPSAENGEALLDVFGFWLVRTVLAIVDLRSTRFVRVTNKVLHDAEATLRRMRLAIGSAIDLTVDDRTLPAAGRLAECVHIDDPDNPLLVLNGTEVVVPSWRALEMLADDLAELIGQAQAASEIRAAALAFERSVGDWREPSDAEIAKVLRCSVEAVTDVLHNLRTSTDHLRLLLAPFVGVLAGIEVARRIDSETVGDLNELHVLLADLIGDDQAAVLFESAARAESVDGIRRVLETELGQLNTMLSELGRPPLYFAELHRTALDSYLNEHRVGVLSALRKRFLKRFDALSSLVDYVTARDFRDIAPDPNWLHDYEVPTNAMMRELLDGWLATKGEPPPPTAKTLKSIDDVREANRSLLDRCLPQIAHLIRAWSTKRALDAGDVWSEIQPVRDTLETSGCLDFVDLEEQQLIEWLDTLDLWPTGMGMTLDPSELGLSVADLDAASSSRSTADDKRRRRRTELKFGEQTFDTANTEGLRELIDAVAASVDDDFPQTRSTPTRLIAVSPPERRSRGPRTGSGTTPRSYGGPKPTQEQTSAIGLAGEVLAYKWLQAAYKETTPDSWVSANRTFLLGGHAGDDSLGYDFRIARKNETLYFEVKATTTDEYEFDIGESELRAARAARKGRYRIIFIRSTFVPEERRLLVLPNPLEPDVMTSFAQINQGMRLRFDPALGRGG